jgi:hypothetical protein
LKQALLATERAMLWSWHRIHLDPSADKKRYYLEFAELWRSYNAITHRYFENLQDHLYIPDGLSGYCRENAEFALVVFEQIGLLASIGLSEALASTDDATSQIHRENAVAIADALAALLRNNPVSGSPRMDEHVIDIVLGLLLLVSTGYTSQALNWLTELVRRADYTFKRKRNFPISTDSTDDLIEATVFGDEELRDRLIKTSWLLPTLAAWSVILKREDLYAVIAKHSKTDYPQVCLQLWHPNQDLFKYVYYQPAHHSCGESEAPIILPDTADEYRSRMVGVLESARHNIISCSPAVTAGIAAIDLIACRHFRTPVPPSIWYQLLHITKVQEPDAGSPP